MGHVTAIRSLTRLLSILVALGSPRWVAADEPQQTREQRRAAIEAHLCSFEYGETWLKEYPNTPFVAVEFADLPTAVTSQMGNCLATILQRHARPQEPGKWSEPGRMTVRVFAAYDRKQDDLVEYQWAHMGRTLHAVASRNALRLDIDLNELDNNPALEDFGPTQIHRLQGLLDDILRLRRESNSGKTPYEIHIPWPELLEEGVRFSTNPEQNIQRMGSIHWFKRLDFFVHGGTLSIRFYFKPDRLMGPQIGSEWFDDDFRALVHAKARAQGLQAPDQSPHEDESD